MKQDVVFEMGELRKLIKEAARKNEFNPTVGKGVETNNKKNNTDSYKETESRMKGFNGQVKKEEKKLSVKTDANRTTLDYTPRRDPDKAYKERIAAQAKGYTSTMEMNNGIEKAAEFDDEGKIFNQFTQCSDKLKKERENLAHAGVNARMLPKVKLNTMYENKTPHEKILRFKHSEFKDKDRMLELIPETYKKDGQVLHMIDKVGNEYIVECVESKFNGNIETKIVDYKNKIKLNEELNRINELFDYKRGTTAGYSSVKTQSQTINEDKQFMDMMNELRNKK